MYNVLGNSAKTGSATGICAAFKLSLCVSFLIIVFVLSVSLSIILMFKVSLEDNCGLIALMKNVSLLCKLTLQCAEKWSVLLMSVSKSIQTFNILKRSDVNPTNHPEKLHSQC